MSDGKTGLGLTPNVTAAIAYAFWLIGGIIVYLIEKENRFVRFHAMQSMIMFGSLFILGIALGFIPLVNVIAAVVMPVIVFICWIMGIIKAANGEYYKFPWVGELAEKQI